VYLHVPMLITVRVKPGLSGHCCPDLATARSLPVLTSRNLMKLVTLTFRMRCYRWM
jgi:hypothetical protein